MNFRQYIFFLFISVIFFASCSKEANDLDASDLLGDQIEMIYDETQCADPWYGEESIDLGLNDQDRINRLISYLQNEGIEVTSVEYEFDEDNVMACLACECLSGGIYKVSIENIEEHISRLEELGFKIK